MFGACREIQTLIGDNLWTIKLVTRVPKIGQEHIKGPLDGLCVFDDCLIYVKRKKSAESMLETLVHEYLHALSHEYNFDLPHPLIRKLEKPISRLLLDNFL